MIYAKEKIKSYYFLQNIEPKQIGYYFAGIKK